MDGLILKLSDGQTVQVTCPSSFEELTTELYQKTVPLYAGLGDPATAPEALVKIFAGLTRQPFEDYIHSEDEHIERHLVNALSFLYEDNLETRELPEFFLGAKLNGNIGKMTLGQNLHVKQHLDGKDIRACISFVIAVYMQPAIDGTVFNMERAKQLEERILQLPISQTYPVGFFFLKKLKASGTQPINLWRLTWLIIENFGSSARILLRSLKLKFLEATAT